MWSDAARAASAAKRKAKNAGNFGKARGLASVGQYTQGLTRSGRRFKRPNNQQRAAAIRYDLKYTAPKAISHPLVQASTPSGGTTLGSTRLTPSQNHGSGTGLTSAYRYLPTNINKRKQGRLK